MNWIIESPIPPESRKFFHLHTVICSDNCKKRTVLSLIRQQPDYFRSIAIDQIISLQFQVASHNGLLGFIKGIIGYCSEKPLILNHHIVVIVACNA